MKAKNRIPRDSLSETVGLEDLANEIAKKIVDAFRNKKCWYASAGGSTSPTFALAFGRKVRRQAPLENEAHPRDYRQYEGEVNLYVEKACRPWLLAISGTLPEPGLREKSEPEAPPDGIGKDALVHLLQSTAPQDGRGTSERSIYEPGMPCLWQET